MTKPRTCRDYTDDDIIKTVKEVNNMAQLLRKLGLKAEGANYKTMKKNLQRLNITATHWTGQGWNKGQRLKDWSEYSKSSSLKPHIIAQKGHRCEICTSTTWMGKQISLEIHHLDGDSTNNDYHNLQLLCPNCHSLTDNWRGRAAKVGKVPRKTLSGATLKLPTTTPTIPTEHKCPDCQVVVSEKGNRCKPCAGRLAQPTKIQWPAVDELIERLERTTFVGLARELGVSDNAIRKKLRSHGLDPRSYTR